MEVLKGKSAPEKPSRKDQNTRLFLCSFKAGICICRNARHFRGNCHHCPWVRGRKVLRWRAIAPHMNANVTWLNGSKHLTIYMNCSLWEQTNIPFVLSTKRQIVFLFERSQAVLCCFSFAIQLWIQHIELWAILSFIVHSRHLLLDSAGRSGAFYASLFLLLWNHNNPRERNHVLISTSPTYCSRSLSPVFLHPHFNFLL